MAFPSPGRNPRPSHPRPAPRVGLLSSFPSRADHDLAMARSTFLRDDRDIDEALAEYERAVEHVLAGGTLDMHGRIGGPPAPRDPTLATTA